MTFEKTRFGDVWRTTYSDHTVTVMAVATNDNGVTEAIILESTDPIIRSGGSAAIHIMVGWEQLREGTK